MHVLRRRRRARASGAARCDRPRRSCVQTCPASVTSCRTCRTPACIRSGESGATPMAAAMRSAVLKPTPWTSSARRYGVARDDGHRVRPRIAARCASRAQGSRRGPAGRPSRRAGPAARATPRSSAVRRFSPSPSTSRSRCGSSSRTRSESRPKVATMRCASFGPTPLMRPEARYRSRPASVSGASSTSDSARSCSPCLRSTSMWPRTRTRAPRAAGGNVPTTASRSARPATASLRTRKLVSALSKVMRSTIPSTTVSGAHGGRHANIGAARCPPCVSYALVSFGSVFSIVDPFAAVPVFLALTGTSRARSRRGPPCERRRPASRCWWPSASPGASSSASSASRCRPSRSPAASCSSASGSR